MTYHGTPIRQWLDASNLEDFFEGHNQDRLPSLELKFKSVWHTFRGNGILQNFSPHYFHSWLSECEGDQCILSEYWFVVYSNAKVVPMFRACFDSWWVSTASHLRVRFRETGYFDCSVIAADGDFVAERYDRPNIIRVKAISYFCIHSFLFHATLPSWKYRFLDTKWVHSWECLRIFLLLL